MPSQEPQLDDKNEEVDVPSEETDGSKYFSHWHTVYNTAYLNVTTFTVTYYWYYSSV